MKEKIVTIGLTILLLTSIILSCIPIITGEGGDVIYVNWDGSEDYTKIQDAIDNASNDDTVFVFPGIYYENIIIDKSLNLTGDNLETTIIDGNNNGDVVTIFANGVKISGFTIQNAGTEGLPLVNAGIRIVSGYNIISGNIIRNNSQCGIALFGPDASIHNSITGNIIIDCNLFGIYSHSSSHNTITENTITCSDENYDNNYGIYLVDFSVENDISKNDIDIFDYSGCGIWLKNACNENTIVENNISYYGGYRIGSSFNGIRIESSIYSTINENIILDKNDERYANAILLYFSSFSTVSGNTIKNFDNGIFLDESHDSVISDNLVEENSRGIKGGGSNITIIGNDILDNGLGLSFGSDNTITGNSIVGNIKGIYLYGSTNNVFTDNTIAESLDYGMWLYNANDNHFYHNNFINNFENIFNNTEHGDETTNTWDNGYPSGGNYWDDYNGIDGNEEGIGDTSYIIPMDSNQDRYPFMMQDGWEKYLEIQTPTEVSENESFQITVTAYDIPIEEIVINFSGETYQTESDGKATLIAPPVTQDTSKQITAYKEGYISDSESITILDTTPPQKEQLIITTPSSVQEGGNFQVTVKANNLPIAQAKVTFDDTEYYTNTDGVVLLVAPIVDNEAEYSITASKTGYLSTEVWISVLNQNIASIQLVSPNGGESWNGNQTIEWAITSPGSLINHALTIQYQYAYGPWETIVENLEDINTPYLWDTKTVQDGYPYIIKVILKKDDDLDGIYETLVSEDTSDAPFAIDNSVTSEGWMHGWITDDAIQPLENAMICIVFTNINNVITSKCMFTDKTGEYTMPIRAGTYTVSAIKSGYTKTTIDGVNIWANETTEVNFTLQEGISSDIDLFLLDENRDEINKAIREQQVGAEISIVKDETGVNYENHVLIYDGVALYPSDITGEEISLRINGDEKSAGKTIIINLDNKIFDPPNELVLKYDGENIEMADDLIDVLDPNNDGLHAEYLITEGKNGLQIAVSIPHFSEHEITISSVVEIIDAVGGINSIILYVIIFSIIAIVFVGAGEISKRF